MKPRTKQQDKDRGSMESLRLMRLIANLREMQRRMPGDMDHVWLDRSDRAANALRYALACIAPLALSTHGTKEHDRRAAWLEYQTTRHMVELERPKQRSK